MHDAVPWRNSGLRIATFNLLTDPNQESSLRLFNAGETSATAVITGTDDTGALSPGTVTVEVPAQTARTYTAGGTGVWRCCGSGQIAGRRHGQLAAGCGIGRGDHGDEPAFEPDRPPDEPFPGSPPAISAESTTYRFLPAASDPRGRNGLLRVTNRSDIAGMVSVRAFDGRRPGVRDARTVPRGKRDEALRLARP